MIKLPVGFRFRPTDEELINNYLIKKVIDNGFSTLAIADVDLNKSEPWDLPGLAKMGETEWYFFNERNKKYTTGERTNRATQAGYWKSTSRGKEIFVNKMKIGMKKILVFYRGRSPKGEKTNWVMYEYRLEGNQPQYRVHQKMNEWVVCKVYQKSHSSGKKMLKDSSAYTTDTTRTIPAGLSQMNCFSHLNQQFKDQNNTHDNDMGITPILMNSSTFAFGSSVISPAPWGFANETPIINYNFIQSAVIPHQFGNSECLPNGFVTEESNNLMQMTQIEFNNELEPCDQGRDIDVDMISSLMTYNYNMFFEFDGNQEYYSSADSKGYVNIGNLWSY